MDFLGFALKQRLFIEIGYFIAFWIFGRLLDLLGVL